ncbi:MAG: glutathione peroxidase [Treponema sp.]|nr:glutathione peroxidase [Candidatus Treponema equifaecale]
MSIYDFKFNTRKGEEVSMADYKDKVLLIVNTATGCGFTPQYKELQAIYEEFKDSGLEILDFPCDQFGHQAPGDNEEIHTFCTGRFGITFPQFAKIEVNGEGALPLFKYLTDNTKFEGFDDANPFTKILMTVVAKKKKDSSDIRWNFTKFLVDRQGNIVKRFEPTADMAKVHDFIKEELAK